MNKVKKYVVTLIQFDDDGNYEVHNWIADGTEDAVNIIEKTIEEIREDYKKQGYNRKEHHNFPGRKKWSKATCLFHISDDYYEFHITKIEDKTKNFFWNCSE